ncbi:MAG: hypothetical protein AMJ79_00640 [Phycisphaerae bacterium SM23_30]|nr:MAG: hypothetical protein AMJ79_00640 [Phycisphaerae bacterium SM23_30]
MAGRNCFVITLGLVLGFISLPTMGQQQEQIEQVSQPIEFLVSKDGVVRRPKNLGDEYKFAAIVSVSQDDVLWPGSLTHQKFLEFVEATPMKYLLEEDICQLFKTQAELIFTIKTIPDLAIRKYHETYHAHTFIFYAPSEQKAKELVRGFVDICTYGGPIKERQRLEGLIQEQEEKKKELNQQIEKSPKVIAEIEAEMKQYPRLSSEVRVTVESRKWLIEIDLAGVRARVNTAQEMIKKYTPSRVPQELENTRITAQIELASLLAQQEKINEILKNADTHDELSRESSKHTNIMIRAQNKLGNCNFNISYCQEHIKDLLSQTFKVENNRVTILPLEERGK